MQCPGCGGPTVVMWRCDLTTGESQNGAAAYCQACVREMIAQGKRERASAVHAQAMRWLRLRRGNQWFIGEDDDVSFYCYAGEWRLTVSVGSDPFIGRDTARALLHAAEIYAREERR